MKSYRISPREWLSAFSTAENRLCRTLVRRRGVFRRFCIFFISPLCGSAKSSGPKKRKQIILIRHLYVPYCEKGVGILTDSCMKFNVFAFSASDFAARRTIVRLARRNRTLQTILSLPFARRLKKRRPKKRIRAIIRLLFGTNTMKADEILSDFSKGMIIRFFYRRKSPLPYVSTATWRFSTILHLFYLSPLRVG